MVLLCVLILVCGITERARAESFVLNVTSGGGWLDVAQPTSSSYCWAASASNMLAYSGWNGGFISPAGIFGEFSSHWSNEFGNPYYGINWWFDGTGEGSPADVTTPGGGGYYSEALFDAKNGYAEPNYPLGNTFYGNVWSYVTGNVAANRVFSMNLGDSGSGIHWLTGWGYDVTAAGDHNVWVTDSWTGGAAAGFWMTLRDDGTHWVSDYESSSCNGGQGGDCGWYVRAMDSLQINSPIVPPNGGGNGTVPEPTSTLLLLGIGLFGLSVGYRKRR